MAEMLVGVIADMLEAKRKYLTEYTKDEDSDGEPDAETVYFDTDIK